MVSVFDLHCDTLDRLEFYGDFSMPGGYAAHDASVAPADMAGLARNVADISLEGMEGRGLATGAPSGLGAEQGRAACASSGLAAERGGDEAAALQPDALGRRLRWCQCFAVFVPDQLRGAEAWALFNRVNGRFRRELERNAERIEQVRPRPGAVLCNDGPADCGFSSRVEAVWAQGKSAAVLTVEGASFLEDDGTALARLDALEQAGAAMVTLTWNGANALGSGNDTPGGLTPFGRRMVAELESRRIAVDVSHLNEQGFSDLCACATRPFAASHSNARAVCDHPRNLADWQLREIGRCGGVVGLNYFQDFLADTPDQATPDQVLRHVEHMLELAGEHAVALGSDYDGCDVPDWLRPCFKVSGLYDLLERAYGSTLAERIFFRNALDFFDRASAL